MMKKRFFLAAVTALILSPVAVAGQTVFQINMDSGGSHVNQLEMMHVERTELATSTIEATYDYLYTTDTLDRTKTKSDVMILQTGGQVSKFYSYNTFRVNSMLLGAVSADAVLADIGSYRGGENWAVYKNHPAGKLSFTDKIGMDYYLIEEELNPQEWRIFNEKKQIEGYDCQRAECDFRGRRWIAWFTPEIPIGEGPWKLSGLPGLILEASDSHGDHSFVLSGLRTVENDNITWPKHQYLKANRADYLRTARKFKENHLTMISQAGTVVRVMGSDGKEIIPTVKVMKYDFLEVDIK